MIRDILCLSILILLSVTSCSDTINYDKLKIIDGIQLGRSNNLFYSQLDSLGIPKESVFTQYHFSDKKSAMNSLMTTYYNSTLFEVPRSQGVFSKHWGVYQPKSQNGSHITGLNVLLVHTARPMILNHTTAASLNASQKAISQNVVSGVVDKAYKQLVDRYGEPKKVNTNIHVKVFEGNSIKEYSTLGVPYVGETFEWETEYYNVRLFKGLNSEYFTYRTTNPISEGYFFYMASNPGREIAEGELPCYMYSYISYDLTEGAIKKLNLNKPAL